MTAGSDDDVVAQRDLSTRIDVLDQLAISRIWTGNRDVVSNQRARRLQDALISTRADPDARRAPVVHHVASDRRGRAAFEPRIAFIVVSVKAAADRDIADAVVHQCSHRMCTFGMRCVHETFGDETVAQNDVVRRRIRIFRAVDVGRTRRRKVLVDGPRRRAVIEDNMVHRTCAAAMRTEGVRGFGGSVARSHRNVLDRHIGRFHSQPSANQRDSRIGGRLSRNNQMRTPHDDRASLEIDDASDLEDHDSRSRIVERLSQ